MKQKSLVSLSVFIIALAVVVISLISVIFPTFVLRSTSDIKDNTINLFELGLWTIPFFIINSILFGLTITYYKKKLPFTVYKTIKLILNFEISPRISFMVVLILLMAYVGFSAGELRQEDVWQDFIVTKDATDNWSVDGGQGFLLGFKYFLLHYSLIIFKNIRIIPFISSMFMLILAYYFTTEITKKRFAGIISLIIILQSNNFLTYNSSPTYSSFWIALYLLSLYLVLKKWYLSPIAYMWSVFSKGLTVVFLPMVFFFIYRSDIPRRIKIWATIPYGIILILFIVASTTPFIPNLIPPISFDYHSFWLGFTSLSSELRFDGLVLIFLLPLTVGLFIASRRGIIYADSVLILIMGSLLSSPLLGGLTPIILEPYRQIPLIIFFAMGCGLIFSKKLSSGPNYFP
jgi:hypothetical protein